jgi:predicted dehydrogenase
MVRVGIVGIGPIAALSWGEPGDVAPYNHAGGIYQSERVTLAAIADLLMERQDAFRQKWGSYFPDTHYYDSIAAMCGSEPLDVISVCVRGPHHFPVMMEVIGARPKAIPSTPLRTCFLEKPPTCSLAEMDEMVAVARAAGIPITVSYSRHWAPSVLRMEELVKGGLIGDVKMVVGYCGGTFLSLASHTTDLICQFAGYDPTAVYARGSVSGAAPEGYEPEPNLTSLIIEFANGVTGVQIGDAGEHGMFYCDVIGSEGRARAGIYTAPYACDKKGKAIDLAALGRPANASPFKGAYDQIAAYLDGGPRPACTDEDWIAVHEIGFAGIESVLTNRRIELPNANRARRIFANG